MGINKTSSGTPSDLQRRATAEPPVPLVPDGLGSAVSGPLMDHDPLASHNISIPAFSLPLASLLLPLISFRGNQAFSIFF